MSHYYFMLVVYLLSMTYFRDLEDRQARPEALGSLDQMENLDHADRSDQSDQVDELERMELADHVVNKEHPEALDQRVCRRGLFYIKKREDQNVHQC